MKTDGGWITISECARLYGKSRKWVYGQIEWYNIETQKMNNRTRFRLADLIASRGEPSQNGAPTHSVPQTQNSQKITPALTPNNSPKNRYETELLRQENEFLRGRIKELEAYRAERRAREARWQEERTRLQRIIKSQPLALPKPETRGVFTRLAEVFRRF